LLVKHYDPAYLRSIGRNFVQFSQAQQVMLDGITPEDFLKAAQQLHQPA